MFDLFRSRAKAVRIFIGALMVLIALSMVTYLIPGGFGNQGSQDQVLAEIGKQPPLTVADFQQRLEMTRRNRNIPPGAAAIFAQQMLDQMISSEALAYEAQRLGITITDADLVQDLRAKLPQLFPNGQFVGTQAYAEMLAQQNVTIPEFEFEMRRDLLIGRITGLVVDNVVVTPEEVVRDYQRREQRVKLDYVVLAPAKLTNQVSITPQEERTYYDGFKSAYRIPERRSFQMLVVDAALVSQRIALSDDQLRRFYDQNRDQYRIPERVHIRHILLKTTGKQPAEVAALEAKAQDLLKQIKAGANFADLARKYSEDPGSGAKGGDLGWIVRDQTVKAFENAAFSLKPNELSGVIKTEYGFHIIQVLEKQEARVKPFEEVKDQIAQDRKQQLAYDTMQQLADQAHDDLVKHPQQGHEIVKRLNIGGLQVTDAAPGQPVPFFGTNPDFSDAIASLAVGGVTPVMQAQGDRLVVAVVTSVTPSRQAELSEVEGQVRAALTKLKVSDTAKQTANEVLAKVKGSGGDFQKVAQQMGLEVKTTQAFGPDGAADGIGTASSLPLAFEQPAGSVFGPLLLDGKQFVCRVAEKVPADMTKFEAQRADIQAALKERKGREQVELFVDSVRTALIREGKIKIHQQVVDRVIAANRS
ncbi:MAG: peptidylprolyl isomerase [Bryobacteraceae bacterium]|jgi:peptidyl-prolyl cis-trans isomerase D